MMKNIIYGLMIFGCVSGNVRGMESPETVSYHSFSIRPKVFSVNLAKTKEIELNRALTRCSETFQNASCSTLEETAEKLIDGYKDIYAGRDSDCVTRINKEEDLILGGQAVTEEMGTQLASMCKGLPVAAFHLSGMYEVIGAYKLALLWIYVAYKLGFDLEKEAGRILLLISNSK